MRHAFIDKYSCIESPLHRLNPSVKIIFSLLFLVYIVTPPIGPVVWSYLGYFFFLLLLIYSSNIPFSFIFKRSAVILPFLVFIILLNTFFKKDGIGTPLLILVRSFLSIMTLILLISTTKFSSILQTLSKWHLPGILIVIFSFMYRYFFILIDEMEKMVRAVKLRSHNDNKLKIFKIFSHIIGVLFIRSYERAERVYYAMVMQGFDGEIKSL